MFAQTLRGSPFEAVTALVMAALVGAFLTWAVMGAP